MKISVLYRELDYRIQENFPQDIEGREDDNYLEEIIAALEKKGHQVTAVRVQEEALQDLQHLDCDLAFNLVEEGLNNDSALEPHLPAILDVFGIPYTGGDFLSIATTQDKARTKEILLYHKLSTPAFQLFKSAGEDLQPGMAYPLIVKPLREDAGIGISLDSVVGEPKALRRMVRNILRLHRQPAIVEEYIEGRELAVGVFEHRGKRRVTPIAEVVFSSPPGTPRVYTYTAKWDSESDEYNRISPTECPAEDLSPEVEKEIHRLALRVFEVLRLRGYGRVDFRLTPEGRLYVLEVNVNPLIGEQSMMAVLARKMGWYFPTFINNIAMEAYRQSQQERKRVTLRQLTTSSLEDREEHSAGGSHHTSPG